MDRLAFMYALLERKRLLFAFIVITACIVFFHRLSGAPLSGDGSHYAEIAREMVRANSLLTPLWDYSPQFIDGKPPVLFWLLGASGTLFGFTSSAMKLPAAVFGLIGVIALFAFTKRYFGHFPAFIAGLALIFCQQYLVHARDAVTDGVFAVFFALALMSFWVARTEKRNGFYYAMGLFVGLALMTRQIPGLFVYAVIAAFAVLAREFRLLKNIHFHGGVLLSLAVALPWYLVMYQLHGARFLQEFFGCVFRFGFQGGTVSPDYLKWTNYLSIIAGNYEPWLPFMLFGLYASVRDSVRRTAIDRSILFVLLWALVPLMIFQAARVKASQYIVPVYFAFSILTALGVQAMREKAGRATAGILTVTAAALAVLYLCFPIIPDTLDSDEYKDTMALVPAAREIEGDLIASGEDGHRFWHYNNGLRFYADKKVIPMSLDEAIARAGSDHRHYFIMPKDAYERFLNTAGANPREIASSRHSVLFTN